MGPGDQGLWLQAGKLTIAALNILFASTKEKPEFWFPLLQKLLPGDRFYAWPDVNGGDIDIAVVATHPKGTFAKLRKLKLIQSLWMGVENIVGDAELPRGVPVARLIDPGMVAAMLPPNSPSPRMPMVRSEARYCRRRFHTF